MTIAARTATAALKTCAIMLSLAAQTTNAQTSLPRAEFHIEGDTADITLRDSGGAITHPRQIDTVDDALAILADERLSAAWPALLAWAGDDLHILRDKALDRAERADKQAVAPLPVAGRAKMEGWNKHFRAFQQYVSALSRSGRTPDAVTRIQAEIAAPTLGANPLIKAQLQIMLANLLFDEGATARAIAVLDQASANAGSPAARQNVDTNLALMLARIGDYDRALKIADATQQAFDHSSSGFLVGHRKLPDSDAYFQAIRACALNGLGRHDEAQAALAAIPAEPATAATLPVKNMARLIAFSCMHDATGLAGELAADLRAAPPATQILLQIQPAREVVPAERETLIAAMVQDVVIQAMAGRARVLGAGFTPALASWRNPASAPWGKVVGITAPHAPSA